MELVLQPVATYSQLNTQLFSREPKNGVVKLFHGLSCSAMVFEEFCCLFMRVVVLVGKEVRPVSMFIHESAENLVFAREGGTINYLAAIRREAFIRRELGITGGFAGGGD